jgi:hypothetical protein
MRKTNVVSALSKVYSVVDPMDCGVGAPHMQTQNRKSLFLKILVDNILNSCLCLMMFLINWCCDKEDKLNLTEKAQTCHMSSLSFGKTCAHFWRIVSLKTMKSTTKLLFFRVHECTV